jgi:nucleoid-associated protein YgaU
MSTRRLIGTSAAMTLLAVALDALTPGVAELTGVLTSAQRTADTVGPDAVVVALAGVLAWTVWAWGAVGLVLTAGSALPGLLGSASHGLLHVVLPAGARRSAAVLLGVGVGVAAPLLPALPIVGAAAVATAAPSAPVPDWPTATPTATPAADPAVPDWPAQARPDGHVVEQGDCLWHLADADLRSHEGRTPTDREIATAVNAWWTANADVIGPDPDLLLPGQVLQPPTTTEELP